MWASWVPHVWQYCSLKVSFLTGLRGQSVYTFISLPVSNCTVAGNRTGYMASRPCRSRAERKQLQRNIANPNQSHMLDAHTLANALHLCSHSSGLRTHTYPTTAHGAARHERDDDTITDEASNRTPHPPANQSTREPQTCNRKPARTSSPSRTSTAPTVTRHHPRPTRPTLALPNPHTQQPQRDPPPSQNSMSSPPTEKPASGRKDTLARRQPGPANPLQ